MTDSNPNPSPSPKPASQNHHEAHTVSFSHGVLGTLEGILKNPSVLLQSFVRNERRGLAVQLFAIAVIATASFGLVLGSFSGHEQWWWAPLKTTGGLLLSAALCLPSLYVFGCLSGLSIRPVAASVLLLSLVALCGLILLGFAPVAWIFAQSTQSLSLVGFMVVVMWGIAVYFGIGLIKRIARFLGAENLHHLRLWLGVFVIVTLQMSTTLRPILGRSDTVLPTDRQFFLEHWWKTVSGERKQSATTSVEATR